MPEKPQLPMLGKSSLKFEFKKESYHILDVSNLIFRYGIESLFRFYSYGLEKKFRLEVYKHFQADTLEDYKNGQLYGLEKFWAFLRYSGRTDQGINPELKAILAKYKSIDDFRVLQSKEK